GSNSLPINRLSRHACFHAGKDATMANLIDYVMDLFRDEGQAQSFVDDPQGALAAIGLPNVTPEQIQAVAAMAAPGGAMAAPAGMGMTGGDPMGTLRQAVA